MRWWLFGKNGLSVTDSDAISVDDLSLCGSMQMVIVILDASEDVDESG